jgi:DtxR family Mn-dependent transcriptional regulator
LTTKNDKQIKVTSTVEDYLERILMLCEAKGEARVTDLAEMMDISKPSVSEKVSRLKKKGFVNYERYGTISLTEKGRKIAERTKRKHDILKGFLELIGVSSENASKDCCFMEHNLSKETVTNIEAFYNFLKGKERKKVLEEFKAYLQKNYSLQD